MEFRDVTALLYGSELASHTIDLSSGRVALLPAGEKTPVALNRSIAFERVRMLKWTGHTDAGAGMRISIVGLERLGAGEPWRLFLQLDGSAELELTCDSVFCRGEEVTGVGRSYRNV